MIRATIALCFLLAACEGGDNAASSADESAPPALEILWEDLLPEGELDRLQEIEDARAVPLFDHEFEDPSVQGKNAQLQTFNVVEELDGKRVSLPGFVTALDYDGRGDRLSAFLLVPYFGACVHYPPPTPNQIVYVKADPAQKLANVFDPIVATGILRVERTDTDLAAAAYVMELDSWTLYEDP